MAGVLKESGHDFSEGAIVRDDSSRSTYAAMESSTDNAFAKSVLAALVVQLASAAEDASNGSGGRTSGQMQR